MIISEERLRETGEGLTIVSARIKIENNYALLECPVEEYISFCKKNNIQTVFCQYDFYDKNEYIVSDELLHVHTENKDEFSYCKRWAEEYNAKIETMDFTHPGRLSLAASLGPMNVVWCEVDNWMQGYEKAEDALITFIETHEDEISELYSMDTEELTLYDEFKKTLLSDSDFRYCTNQTRRIAYVNNFINKKSNKRFLKLVKKSRSGLEAKYALYDIVDKIYNEYRNACYRAKVHVGEELPVVEEE